MPGSSSQVKNPLTEWFEIIMFARLYCKNTVWPKLYYRACGNIFCSMSRFLKLLHLSYIQKHMLNFLTFCFVPFIDWLIDFVHIVERDACLWRSQIRMGRIGTWKKCQWGMFHPFFCALSREGGDHSLPSNYINTWEWGMVVKGSTIKTLTWGRVFWGCFFCSFGSSEILLAAFHQGWENLPKIYWPTKSTLMYPKAQEHLKFGQ